MQLSGELSKVSFANLLQLVRSGGLAGKITLAQGARQGSIDIDGGLPVHGEVENFVGKEALFEFFLWQSGTFAFSEVANYAGIRTISFNSIDDTFERFLKDGLSYLQAKQYLDELAVGPQSILKAVDDKGDYASLLMQNPGLERIDGVRTLADALFSLNLTDREFVLVVADWFYGGLVQVAKPDYGVGDNQVDLPDWVVARLKQDNPDLAQAIVSMVIWVDRVKCWMYQADADFERILGKSGLAQIAARNAEERDENGSEQGSSSETGAGLSVSNTSANKPAGGEFTAPTPPPS